MNNDDSTVQDFFVLYGPQCNNSAFSNYFSFNVIDDRFNKSAIKCCIVITYVTVIQGYAHARGRVYHVTKSIWLNHGTHSITNIIASKRQIQILTFFFVSFFFTTAWAFFPNYPAAVTITGGRAKHM
jgi:hypothetical protein